MSLPPKFVGALDQGTSSTRFALFNEAGDLVDSHQIENRIISSQPGWAEHDPISILSITRACMDQVMQNFNKNEFAGIGITNQRESVVIWDKSSGAPLYNAILWLDTRTSSVCSELEKRYGSVDHFRPICGLPISTYFSATKIIWLIQNIPMIAKAVEDESCYIGTIDSWLIWNLTGGVSGGLFVTDLTNASRTMLFDLHSLSWSEQICFELRIPSSCLPRIISNSEVVGAIKFQSPLDDVPISGCIGDQHAAMVGQLCLQEGDIKATYGTGAFMLLNTGPQIVQSQHGLLTTITAKLGPNAPVQFALEGSIAYSGAVIQWMRDNMNLISTTNEIGQLASSVEDNGGVYFVPAFSGLFAPHWRDDARGLIIGLTQHSSKAHLARAALESVCFSIREVVSAMENDSKSTISRLRVDGGMSVSDFIMQLQSEILHIQVERPLMPEMTAFGAAIAAGLAVRFWNSLEDISSKQSSSYRRFEPVQPKQVYDKFFNQYLRAIQRCIGWIENKREA